MRQETETVNPKTVTEATKAAAAAVRGVLVVLSMLLALGLLGGCDATSGGVRVQPASPFPYNSPHG